MQKIRLQIMLDLGDLNALHRFMQEHHCKNESRAISQVFIMYTRLQFIIKKLEEKAHEVDRWKEKAEGQSGVDMKPIIVADVKKNTDLKQKSAGNIKDIQKHKGGN